MFGAELKSSFLHNMSEKPGYASLIIRLVFAGLLLVHIPYIFLPAKECILLMYFEHKQRFLSDHLEQKLAESLESKKKDKGSDGSDAEDETDPMIGEKEGEGTGARKRSRGDAFTEDDKDEESDGKEQEEGLEVERRVEQQEENVLDQTAHSVSVSFVSDVNKFLPAVQALYIDETTYYYFSLTAHLIVVLGALFIQDIRTIFDFIGCFGGTFILFWFPSVIFLLMLRKYGRTRHRNSFEYTFYKVMAYLLFILGCVSFCLEMTVNIQNLKGEGGAEETAGAAPEAPAT